MAWTVTERLPSGRENTGAGSEAEAWKIADDIMRKRNGVAKIEIYNDVGIIASIDDVRTRLKERRYPGAV